MNILETHQSIMDSYDEYINSFITIKDSYIKIKVKEELEAGKLWDEPLIQFIPQFK